MMLSLLSFDCFHFTLHRLTLRSLVPQDWLMDGEHGMGELGAGATESALAFVVFD